MEKKTTVCACVRFSSPHTHRMSPLHILTTPAYYTQDSYWENDKNCYKKKKNLIHTNTAYFPLAN